MTKFKYIIIHHTAHLKWTFDDVKAYHINIEKYKDIGYNFFIEKDGTVKTGRSLTMIGAHTYGYNEIGIGVCLAGNFEIEMPTKQQLSSLTKTLDNLRRSFNIPKTNILRHIDTWKTACPGRNLYKFIEDYKKQHVIEQLEQLPKTNSVNLEYGIKSPTNSEEYMLKIKLILNILKSLLIKSDGKKTITGVAITLLSGLLGSQAATVIGLVTTAIGLSHKALKAVKEVIVIVKAEVSKK